MKPMSPPDGAEPGSLRLLLGDCREVAALVEIGDDRLGLVLGLHQDVTDVDFVFGNEFGDLLVEAL